MSLRVNDLSCALVALEQDSTLVCVIELGLESWLVLGLLPGVTRQPQKKLGPDPEALLKLLQGWRREAEQAGHRIDRIAVAYEAGRDGFWLARWLLAHGIEAHVIHPTSVPVSQERRRAKTDRLDTRLLMRSFLGWLRGEPKHCQMAPIPGLEQEDARRPSREREGLTKEKTRLVNRMKSALIRLGIRSFKPELRKAEEKLGGLLTPEGRPLPANTLAELRRDMARLRLVKAQIKEIDQTREARLNAEPDAEVNAMTRRLAEVLGLGLETADMLTQEVMSRPLRDRRAVARFAGLTGSPDESGRRRREKGLSKAGSARVRRGMIQLAWRFLRFQSQSELARWWRARLEAGAGKKTLITALARKLLIALWRLATQGVVPKDWVLRAQA